MGYTIKKYHGSYNIQIRTSNPDWIVLHYTGSGTSKPGSARANCVYFSGGNRNASAHYFVDDRYIYEYADPKKYTTWHCGTRGKYYSSCRNYNSIGIEVCLNGDKPYTSKEIERAEWLVKRLQSQFDIPDSHVIRHYDVTHKACPYYYTPSGSGGNSAWNKLKKTLTSEASSNEIWQIDEDGKWGPDTTSLAQAIEGIDISGVIYNQPNSNKKCFDLDGGQASSFNFTSNPKKNGSLLIRRYQNDMGISWSDCDGWAGPEFVKKFIKKWYPNATRFDKLLAPSTAVKNFQKHLNKQARILGVRTDGTIKKPSSTTVKKKTLLQCSENGYWGTGVTKVWQAINGIEESGMIYRQPNSAESFLKAMTSSKFSNHSFKFVRDSKIGDGSLAIKRLQNRKLGIDWSECTGVFDANTRKLFIKKYCPGAEQFTTINAPSTAVKNFAKEINKEAKKLGIKR